VDHIQQVEIVVNIEYMEKPFDRELSKLSKNQLVVLRYLLLHPDVIVGSRELARKTGIVEKQLGGVLSAMSRKRVAEMSLMVPMGRVEGGVGLRWRLNRQALTVEMAGKLVKNLLLSF
jgi:hypothetical protein